MLLQTLGTVLCLFAKKLQLGRFNWRLASDRSVVLTSAQVSYLLEGID
ncbi:IS66 family insertion sequence element accessory protein TnpB [Hwanghaeella sp. 1Z406]